MREPRKSPRTNHAGDLGSAEIDALEAISVVDVRVNGLLEVVSSLDHGDLLIDIEVNATIARRQLQQSLLGFVVFAVTDEPPRTLRSEDNAYQDERRPDPLKSKWNAIGPLVFSVEHAAEDTGSNELSHDPAEVDVRGQIRSQHHWCNIRSVGHRNSLEDTPGQSAEDRTSEKGLDILRKNWQEDESNHEDQRSEHSLAVAKALRQNAVQPETDN